MVSVAEPDPRFTFHKTTYCQGFQQNRKGTYCAALVTVHEGTTLIEVEGVGFELSAHQCGLFVARNSIGLIVKDGYHTRASLCIASSIHPISTIQSGCAPLVARAQVTSHISVLFELGLSVSEIGSALSEKLNNSIGDAVFNAFVTGLEMQRQRNIPASLLRIGEYFRLHFCETFNFDQVATDFGISRGYLITGFRKYIGVSPMRYIWRLRTEKAIHLVCATKLTLAEIADQCAYKSQYHLSRTIKNRTGFCPRELRRNPYAPSIVESCK